MQHEYLVRFQDPNVGVRHTIVIATDEIDLHRRIRQRLATPTWQGCKLVWAADVLTLQPRQDVKAIESLAQAVITKE